MKFFYYYHFKCTYTDSGQLSRSCGKYDTIYTYPACCGIVELHQDIEEIVHSFGLRQCATSGGHLHNFNLSHLEYGRSKTRRDVHFH